MTVLEAYNKNRSILKELFTIYNDKNYPRYPVDLLKISLIFLGTSEDVSDLPDIIAQTLRENPFGTAFIKKAVDPL